MENQAPETILPQQPKSNPILFVVIGVAILAAGVGIGLVVGKYFQPASSTTSVSTITPFLTPSPTVVPAEAVDSTANWKTYTNLTFGYSINVPNGWETFRQTGDDSIISIRLIKTQTIPISINAQRNSPAIGTDEWIDKQFSADIIRTKETVNGLEWTIILNSISSYPSKNYYLIRENTRYNFNVSTLQENYLTFADQILSTFKFIEPAASPTPQISYVKPEISDTSNWKLYTLENIQFKAPQEARVSITDGDAVITLPESVMPSANIMLRTYDGGSRREWWIKEINATPGEVSKYMKFQDVMLGGVAALDVFGDGGWWQGGYASPILISKGKTIIAVHGGRGLNPETGKTSRYIFSDSVASTIKFIQ